MLKCSETCCLQCYVKYWKSFPSEALPVSLGLQTWVLLNLRTTAWQSVPGMGKSGLLSIFVSKVSLKHSHTHSFTYCQLSPLQSWGYLLCGPLQKSLLASVPWWGYNTTRASLFNSELALVRKTAEASVLLWQGSTRALFHFSSQTCSKYVMVRHDRENGVFLFKGILGSS